MGKNISLRLDDCRVVERSSKDYDAVGLCAQSKVAARGDAGVRFVGSRRVGARGEWRGTCRSCLSGNDALRRVRPARDEGPPLISLGAHRTIRRRNAPLARSPTTTHRPLPRSLSRVRRWSSTHAPVATVRSGDVVHLWTVSGEPGAIPLDAHDVPRELQDIWLAQCGARDGTQPGVHPPAKFCGAPGPHVMTGPIAVLGARPGDILRVDVLSAEPWTDWGWNAIRPGKGALGAHPEFATHPDRTVVVPIHRERRTCSPPWAGEGVEISLDATGTGPFFGQMGVAPDPRAGVQTSVLPGPHGGNLDNKRLGPGSSVYFRVNVPGAGFSAGDGHAIQGDGEFCVTALETSLEGRFRLTLLRADDSDPNERDDVFAGGAGNGTNPRAETSTHYLTMAFHEDLDVAEELVLLDMLTWMGAKTGLGVAELYRTASLVGDMHVTQVVNGRKGVHLMMPKSVMNDMAAAAARERERKIEEKARGDGSGDPRTELR